MPRSIRMHDVRNATSARFAPEAHWGKARLEPVAVQLSRAMGRERRWEQLLPDDDLDLPWREEEGRAFLHAVADVEHVDTTVWP